ncbi:MAG: InlB B-repeat-containing protein [Prevotella sp.]|nr:InlB B-repeat-containing protein [Prevotella sp.]
MTLTLPSGYKAKSVTFYVTTNADDDANLSEINGTSCSDVVTSHKDGTNPTVITKELSRVNSFTFTFSTKQVFFVAVVDYQLPVPDITTQPVSATYQKDATATALTVVATASAGDLSYQWYSCDDANKSNAAVINGETSSSYTPSTATVGTFYYFCRVADTNGTTDSNVATISVSEASVPTISIVASATTVYVGNAVNLTATVSGVPTPTIQWYSCTDAEKTNPAAIDGAINETYAPSTTTEGTYYYYAVATNSEGSATSDVITLTVNPLYTVTFSLGDATGVTGTVPSAVEVESAVTLPTNQTLYKEGYTLTGWNDGTTTYAAGASATITANTTMTAVFTANTVDLGVCPATITWQFQTGQGAPAWSHQGDAAFPYVAQMALGSETIDMALTMDASDGKIANANWTDWSQMNGGTKLTAPVVKGAVLKLYVYGEGSTPVTFNGTAGTYSSNIYSYTATAADGTTGSVEIVIGDQSYTKYLTVEYPTVGVKVYDYATSVGNGTVGNSDQVSIAEQSINGTKVNVIKFNSSLSSDKATNYWKITPAAGKFQKGDRVIWTGCYSNSSTKTTTIAIYDDDAISSAIVTGESFANVNGGSASSPKSLTTGYFTLSADAEALYIGRSGGTATYLTALTVVRENATIKPAHNKSTYVASTALDFSGVAGLKAYRASDASAGKVTLDEVTTVPAGTPLLLIGTADTEYSVPALETADAIGTNLLVAGDGSTEFDGTTYDYILYSDGLFYQIGSGSVAVGKAYLHCESDPTAAGSRSLAISFGDETTGISSMHNSQCIMHNEIYNLSGQRVGQPVKGLYIVNGKKVLVK